MSSLLTSLRPSLSASNSKITYEEFLDRYDGVHAEWIDGEVILMSPVSNVHQRIGNFLFRLISDFVEAHDLGQVFQSEFQMKLSGVGPGREPDIFFFPHEHSSDLRMNYFDGPGHLVIEIISPESIQRDHVTKFEEYQQAGVKEYWLIDPLTQQSSFFLRDTSGRFQSVLTDVEGKYHSRVLPGLWVKTEWFWQSPSPLMSEVRKELGLS